jgi:hypothetical protein
MWFVATEEIKLSRNAESVLAFGDLNWLEDSGVKKISGTISNEVHITCLGKRFSPNSNGNNRCTDFFVEFLGWNLLFRHNFVKLEKLTW